MLRNIKLIVSYDGTDFSGWQAQNAAGGARTVQGTLEKALAKLHGHEVKVNGAGRTDAGVHARAQAANFFTDMQSIPPHKFVLALNSGLPHDVRVMEAEEVGEAFHARFDARRRVYRYRIIAGREALPWERRYALCIRKMPSIERLNSLASVLRGEMDCSLFASPHDKSVSRYRFIHYAHFSVDGEAIIFEICANAFLWKMVRCIVGTLLYLESEGKAETDLAALLATKNHTLAGTTAPPHGLTLWYVGY